MTCVLCEDDGAAPAGCVRVDALQPIGSSWLRWDYCLVWSAPLRVTLLTVMGSLLKPKVILLVARVVQMRLESRYAGINAEFPTGARLVAPGSCSQTRPPLCVRPLVSARSFPTIGCCRAWPFGVTVAVLKAQISHIHRLCLQTRPFPPHRHPRPLVVARVFFFNPYCRSPPRTLRSYSVGTTTWLLTLNRFKPTRVYKCALFGASAPWRTIINQTSRRCRRSGTSPPGSGSTPSRRQLQRPAGNDRNMRLCLYVCVARLKVKLDAVREDQHNKCLFCN